MAEAHVRGACTAGSSLIASNYTLDQYFERQYSTSLGEWPAWSARMLAHCWSMLPVWFWFCWAAAKLGATLRAKAKTAAAARI